MTYTRQTDDELQPFGRALLALVLCVFLANSGRAQSSPSIAVGHGTHASSQASLQTFAWKSPARLRRGAIGGVPGTLSIDAVGMEFAPAKGANIRWSFLDIKSLDMRRHQVVLTAYKNRKWHLPKLLECKFSLEQEMPPSVAASLAEEVNKPTRNRIPDPNAPAIRVIAIRRSDHFGGSNGLLRIRQQGIDYVTPQADQSRSWRWADLQSLSHPDPYHLLVFGYRDTYAFDLKEPLSRELFNHISDEIWAHNESDVLGNSATLPASAPALSGWSQDE